MTARREGHLVASSLVALGVYCSARPVGDLFSATPWRSPLVVALLVVVLLGSLTRKLGAARFAPLSTAVGLAALLLWNRDGMALSALPSVWSGHVLDAVTVIRESPVPAPATPGVAFTLTAAFAFLGWLADLITVTWRRPALGGLVMVIPFLIAVANSNGPLAWPYAASVGACWVAVLAISTPGRQLTSAWLAPAAVVIGIGALAGAIILGAALPRLPVRYVADGLGRGGTGQVGFSPSPAFLSDLTNDDRTPVLRFRTDDPDPPPLRVALSSSFQDGAWVPRAVGVPFSATPALSYPFGLDPETDITRRSITVTETRLQAPYIAAPAPVIAGSVVGSRWAADQRSTDLRVERQPDSYTFTYAEIDPRGHDNTDPLTDAEIRPLGNDAWLGALAPGPYSDADFEAVFRASDEATAEVAGQGPYARATAIQNWLRDPQRFRYSLTLPNPPTGTQNATELFEWFMRERTGYCVQFTTAMVLMARAQGIPARVATGFLPGRPVGNEREVVAADAHAWPELYFSDLGWIRFEPTPAARTGAAPQHTAATPNSPRPSVSTPDDTPSTSAKATRPPQDREGESARTDASQQPAPTSTRALWLATLLVGVALVVALSLLPARAWWIRRRRLQQARNGGDAALCEAYWQNLLERMQDLHRAPPAHLSPRAAQSWIRHIGPLSPKAHEALLTLSAAVETGRYAPAAEPLDEAEAAAGVRLVVSEARQLASRKTRIMAALAPGVALRR
ncbi:transglutaminaseTgpA domain-containing protein [Gephyromycinifex aptenodytis]|uniref:transglutaminaseTgpA domain-containing protein n=1 Tax=Gephyromycinifex aptenodytis TaxID=2716227 RepID=UPI00144527EE|nr:transglutaminaseTgpA domain-containing protein [Gephyromycinifex aptenodytis]